MGVPKLWHTEMIEVYETLLAYNQAMPSPPSAIEDGENLPSILTIRYTRKVRNYQKRMISLVELCVPSSIYSVSNWMDWILLMWCLWCILNVCLLSEWIGSWHCLKTISRKLNFFFFWFVYSRSIEPWLYRCSQDVQLFRNFKRMRQLWCIQQVCGVWMPTF